MKQPPSKFWRFIRAIVFYPIFGLLFAWPLSSTTGIPYVFAWFIMINLFGFWVMAKDKIATQFEWQFTLRTQLSVAYFIGFIGGFPGIFLGQNVFNHRTQEKLLTTCMWAVFMLQLFFAILSVTDSFKEYIDDKFQAQEGQTAAEFFNLPSFGGNTKPKAAQQVDDYYAPQRQHTPPKQEKPREKTAAEMLFGK